MEQKDKHQPTYYLIGSLLFCLGYLLIIIDVYYQSTYSKFIENGRTDLIERLGFLTFATGITYYPFVIVPIFILTWASKRSQKIETKSVWIGSAYGVIIIGLLFYMRVIAQLMFLIKYNLVVGILLIGLSVILFWNLLLSKKIKAGRI